MRFQPAPLARPKLRVCKYESCSQVGARFGTSSCRLARATNNSGNVVSVDPDRRTTASLLANRRRHRCNFHAISGTVSAVPLQLGPQGTYNQRTVVSPSARSAAGAVPSTRSQFPVGRSALRRHNRSAAMVIPNFNLLEVERLIGGRFNAALIDCEGCIGAVLSIPSLLAQLELILLEEDMYVRNGSGAVPGEQLVHYQDWHQRLERHGFAQVWRAHDTFSPESGWSRFLYHSAWQRLHGARPRLHGARPRLGAVGTTNLCEAYRDRHPEIPRTRLHCAPLDEGPWDAANVVGGAGELRPLTAPGGPS